MFDKRGTGLSDRGGGIAPLETRMDDVRAVMDAAGSERAALLGISEGGPMTLLFAATYPARTTAVVIYGSAGATYAWTPETPWEPRVRRFYASSTRISPAGGRRDAAANDIGTWLAPRRAGDEEFIAWWAASAGRARAPAPSRRSHG